MTKNFTGFNFKRHQAVGKYLSDAHIYFVALDEEISNCYGKSSKASKLVSRLCSVLDLLREELDDRVHEENPVHIDQELARVYYPRGE